MGAGPQVLNVSPETEPCLRVGAPLWRLGRWLLIARCVSVWPMRLRVRRAVFVMALPDAACLTSCVSPAPRPQPLTVATLARSEEVLQSEKRSKIAITDLDEPTAPDRKVVTVLGIVVNRGPGPIGVGCVRVNAPNRDGAVVARADSDTIGGVSIAGKDRALRGGVGKPRRRRSLSCRGVCTVKDVSAQWSLVDRHD